MDSRKLWQAVLGELEINLSEAVFKTWFKQTSIIGQENGHVVVAVPNIIAKGRLEKNYHTDIKNILKRLIPALKSVEYKITTGTRDSQPATHARDQLIAPVAVSAPSAITSGAAFRLNTKYTLDNFVVGPSNELAVAASQAVVSSPGTKYSPLFIYGGVGVGKTHLIQGLGNEIVRRDPARRVGYVTSEDFTREFIDLVSAGKKTKMFAEKYRNLDVLIVDDIQFLGNKERTQEEFFHTFNALHQANKQVILSSDKPPKAIPHLEERLRSRFEWGMIADIQAPELETRAAIVQRKAAVHGFEMPLDVMEHLARHFKNNIRELEGALTHLMAMCEVRGLEPSIDTVNSLLGTVSTASSRRRTTTPKTVIEKTAAFFDLRPEDITGLRRDKDIVVPRQISMYIMRHDLGLSFPKIASQVGGRDHTTAMHSVTKIEKLLETDESLRNEINQVKERMSL